METYIRIIFDNLQQQQREELIARLTAVNYEGFEESGDALDAFIPQSLFDVNVLNEIVGELAYGVEEIEPRNWNAEWESGFDPVQVGSFAIIRAAFHNEVAGITHDIIITPKMSFGTGHHATTAMMIEQIGKLDLTNKQVFDFGTGTGVLAILAEKCGAAGIYAVDNDDWSISNAEENIKANGCRRIILEKSEVPFTDRLFDIILANINRNVLLENMNSLVEQLSRQGTIVLSGILADDEKDMIECLHSNGMRVVDKNQGGQWLCLQFNRFDK